jgi:hypothetical protein
VHGFVLAAQVARSAGFTLPAVVGRRRFVADLGQFLFENFDALD